MKLFKKRQSKLDKLEELTKYNYNKLVEELNQRFDDSDDEIDSVRSEVDEHTAELLPMIKELSNNGVIRDLRKLEKDHKELAKHTSTMVLKHEEQLDEMETNGIATEINKLNKEVFTDKKESRYNIIGNLMAHISGDKHTETKEVTLAGKVDAIIKHLGIDVEVKPREVKESEVVVKKLKKGKK